VIQGTNFIWTINKSYTDGYKDNRSFFNTHSNAIAKAFEFANLLITNPIPAMATNMVTGLFLTREFAPYQMPLSLVADMRQGYGTGTYFLPSLLGFQIIPHGPAGANGYLWGVLPIRETGEVDSIPIIYYQNRWWISTWLWEDREPTW
jgi:hypothetical protein